MNFDQITCGVNFLELEVQNPKMCQFLSYKFFISIIMAICRQPPFPCLSHGTPHLQTTLNPITPNVQEADDIQELSAEGRFLRLQDFGKRCQVFFCRWQMMNRFFWFQKVSVLKKHTHTYFFGTVFYVVSCWLV